MCASSAPKTTSSDTVQLMESEIDKIHTCLELRGINSRGDTDIFGRPFHVPVNHEHKAKYFTTSMLLSIKQPHMRTFWASTIGFCTTFFSVFAPAALGPYIKKPKADGGLGIDKENLSLAGNLAVTGTILMRVGAGPMCDKIGARKTFVCLLMIAMPGLILLMTAQGAGMFIAGRVIVGLSLATFVTCQVWCSQFFAADIVGTVNATAGGWGNLGGGITLLVMPQIMEIFISMTEGSMTPKDSINFSWRLCFAIPMVLHLLAALFVYSGRDLTDGTYAELEVSGAKQKSKDQGGGWHLVKVGFSNTNALILMLTYGLCFGVELTMNNKLVTYFNTYYGIAPSTAGVLGATFSLMNLFARSWGGMLSDYGNKVAGMRGRIASMWVIQTLCGVFCLLLGVVTIDELNPDSPEFQGAPPLRGVYVDTSGLENVDYYVNGSQGFVKPCGSDEIRMPEYCSLTPYFNETLVRCPLRTGTRIMIKDPNPECMCNGNTLGVTMIIIIIFSLWVQMAEGLHFGIVPKVSRPAVGVVSGMVGAGGNFGAVISGQFIIGSGKNAPLNEGFIYLGIVIMAMTLSHHFIFFPGQGGILLPKNFPYDPQWIKPLEGAKGADELQFTNIDISKTKRGEESLAAAAKQDVSNAA